MLISVLCRGSEPIDIYVAKKFLHLSEVPSGREVISLQKVDSWALTIKGEIKSFIYKAKWVAFCGNMD
jgi:hypothetical protein